MKHSQHRNLLLQFAHVHIVPDIVDVLALNLLLSDFCAAEVVINTCTVIDQLHKSNATVSSMKLSRALPKDSAGDNQGLLLCLLLQDILMPQQHLNAPCWMCP